MSKDQFKALSDYSHPAYGMARILSDELVSIDCGMEPRLNSTELASIAAALKGCCENIDRIAGDLEEQEAPGKPLSEPPAKTSPKTLLAKDLDEQSTPAEGLAEILFNGLVSIEADKEPTTRLSDLIQLADSLRIHCHSLSFLASKLFNALEGEP
ncbi:hypothetical protein [Endozoicomonas arenosclerae]|uniref:hypothetical protein n=1 Tax=Endozoicomonas arenosclerae TaxID=1633495 RepID=UPI000AD30CA9|nr:hypothetical protein [Endozoicomonas arenosclerae]